MSACAREHQTVNLMHGPQRMHCLNRDVPPEQSTCSSLHRMESSSGEREVWPLMKTPTRPVWL